MKNFSEKFSAKELSDKREEKIEWLADRLLNVDFENPNTMKSLKGFFGDDIFLEEYHEKEDHNNDWAASFINFLQRLQDQLKIGNYSLFKSIYELREKIKYNLQLTQGDIEMGESLDLHHWKGANVSGRKIAPKAHLDMRDIHSKSTKFSGTYYDFHSGALIELDASNAHFEDPTMGDIYNSKIGKISAGFEKSHVGAISGTTIDSLFSVLVKDISNSSINSINNVNFDGNNENRHINRCQIGVLNKVLASEVSESSIEQVSDSNIDSIKNSRIKKINSSAVVEIDKISYEQIESTKDTVFKKIEKR